MKNKRIFLPVLMMILFLLIIRFFFYNIESDNRLSITKSNCEFLQKNILLYKKYYNKFPDTLQNLITDTYIFNGQPNYFIDEIPPEITVSDFSTNVQVNGAIKKNGTGWLYNNKTGEIKINNFNYNKGEKKFYF